MSSSVVTCDPCHATMAGVSRPVAPRMRHFWGRKPSCRVAASALRARRADCRRPRRHISPAPAGVSPKNASTWTRPTIAHAWRARPFAKAGVGLAARRSDSPFSPWSCTLEALSAATRTCRLPAERKGVAGARPRSTDAWSLRFAAPTADDAPRTHGERRSALDPAAALRRRPCPSLGGRRDPCPPTRSVARRPRWRRDAGDVESLNVRPSRRGHVSLLCDARSTGARAASPRREPPPRDGPLASAADVVDMIATGLTRRPRRSATAGAALRRDRRHAARRTSPAHANERRRAAPRLAAASQGGRPDHRVDERSATARARRSRRFHAADDTAPPRRRSMRDTNLRRRRTE